MKKSIKNAIKVAAEILVIPGSSLLTEGRIKDGAIHAGLALLSKSFLGLPSLLVLGASSFYRSLEKKEDKADEIKADDRIEGLDEKVRAEVEDGMTLEEIKAGIQEDVEDTFFEVQQNNGKVEEKQQNE